MALRLPDTFLHDARDLPMDTLRTANHNPDRVPECSQWTRVLIVDDDPGQIETLLEILKDEGFEARGCRTAKEALSTIEKEDIGIAVIDLRLPDIQGPQLVSLLLEKKRSIKAIIHTGYGSFDAAKEAINLGAFAFVEKGGEPQELLLQIHRAVESRLNQYAEELEAAVTQRTAELTQAQKWQDALVRSVHGILWEYDVPTLRFTYVSEQAEHILGYPVQQWITEPTFWQDHVHPEDRDWAWTFCQESTTQKKDHALEYRMIAKDGRTVWLHELVTVIVEHDRPVKLQGVMIDITERKRTELERAERDLLVTLMLNTGPGCIKRVAADGTLLHMNQAGLKFIEATSEQEAIGLSVFDLVLPEFRPAFEAMHRNVLQGKAQTLQFEIQGLQGTRRWMETYAVPFQNPITNHIEHLAVTHDITERKNIEERERSAQHLIKAVNDVQAQFMEGHSPANVFDVLLTHLLDLTKSEYGFIGEVLYTETGNPYLRCHAVTDIAWNDATRELVKTFAPNLEFFNLDTLFGQVMTTGEPVIANDPAGDPRSGGLPAGHPPLNAFLGLPFFRGDQLIGLVGIANRPGGYDHALVEYLQPFLSTYSSLIEAYGQMEKRQKAEAELLASEERYRVLYDDNPSMYFSVSPEGTVLSVNRFGAEQLGYRPEELIGKSVFTVIYEDDRETVSRALASAFAQPARISTWEFRKVKKSGELIWVGEKVRVLPDTGAGPVALIVCEDITERKLAQESVRTLESQLHQAIQASRTGLWDWNTQTNDVFFSAEWKKQLGYDDHELANRFEEWERRLHPADHDRVLDYAQRYAANPAGEYYQEFRLRHKDGSYRWIAARASFVPETDGRRMRLLGSHIDITAMKKLEEQLQASEERLQLALEATNEGVWDWNLVTNEVTFSAQWCRSLGFAPEEVEPHVRFWERLVHPDDMPRVQERLNAHLEGRTPIYECENRLLTKAGTWRWNLDRGKVVAWDQEGKPTRMIGVDVDITERKRADEALSQFHRIVSSSRSLLSLIDRDYRYQAVNQKYLDMFGVPPEHFLGQPVGKIIGQEAFEQVFKPNGDRCLSGEVVNFKHWVDFPKEGRRYLDVQLSPYIDDQQRVQAIVLEARDITDLYHLEEQVRQSQKLEAIGTLAAGIAHDFNNILTAILGFGELASTKVPENPAVRHNLAEIVTAGKRAKDLVRQILLFSRQAESRWEPLDLQLVVQETLRFLRASVPSTIDISQDLGTGPIIVNGDVTKLEQVILNLGANAEHAMRSREGQLTVTLQSVELDHAFVQSSSHLHPGLYAKVTIRDTGRGIAPDVLPKIFDPFFTTKEVNEGTGLGLSVAHGIVAAHGGLLTVDSELGRGTTFAIYLPQASPTAEERESASQGKAQLPALTGKILFLDDEAPLARLAQELLGALKFDVVAFTEPGKALEAFRADPENFAVVMTDQHMPGMTGIEVARELLAIRPTIPIVLSTGYGHTMTLDKARSLGIASLLMKPFQREDLLSALYTALTRQEEGAT